MDGPLSAVVDLACSALHSDGELSTRPEARLAFHEVLSHVLSSENRESTSNGQVKLLATDPSKADKGVKRQITPDSIMSAEWQSEPDAKRPANESAASHPLDHGSVLEAEFIAAEVARLNAAAKLQAVPPVACQVCGLNRDRWECATPLYLNARDQPVKFPGSFCSKDCFEHV